MVNIHPHKDVEKMVAYHRDHLVADTAAARYYSQGGQSVGQWYGKTAELLKLTGVVDAEDFERVSSNLHPATGKQLTPRKRKDAVAAYDFCVSVFKSASVVGLGMDDERVVDILRVAAFETLKEAEALASVRVRKGSNQRDESRLTGNLAPLPCSRRSCSSSLYVFKSLFSGCRERELARSVSNLENSFPKYRKAASNVLKVFRTASPA